MKTQKRRLMWHGMLLFLLGLITEYSSNVSPTCAWAFRHTWRV